MLKESILGIVRHAMTAAGGYLAGNGTLEASQVETLTGATVAIAGVVWSILQKCQKETTS